MNISCWTYILENGFEVLAGKTDVDNDTLSLTIAKPNDYWFHASGSPGSHVILRHLKTTSPAREILEQAASIAAWHSKSRNNKIAKVTYTLAKNISKPRGSSPGSVNVKRTKILKVRPGLPAY